MTSPTTRTGFDDPFDGEDAKAVLAAAAEAVDPLAERMVPARLLEELCEDLTRMIESEQDARRDPDADETDRDRAGMAAFALEGARELVNRQLGKVFGLS
ncbi:hypothetical protein CcI49_02970 [Frankia sp. CcI49]|uniref:hypothetical protein n=1 Tax=Frankia sp. CcI49 TaxID=1745382 RepID=UPI0009771D1B|nr:hypothetical protein [Frankia sp. CcI49]ONH62357.1 hypothetical protein CcI49_02970 [Frankia sp. CcI49]